MTPCHGPLEFLIYACAVLSGFSWLYWLREIAAEVNKTLPENKQVRWNIFGRPARTGWLWAEHGRLFPESRSRSYASLSFVLFFLIPIAAFTTCLLIAAS